MANPYLIYGGLQAGGQLMKMLGGAPDPYKRQRNELRSMLGKDVIDVDNIQQASTLNMKQQLPMMERFARRKGLDQGVGANAFMDKASPLITQQGANLRVKNDMLTSQKDMNIRGMLAGMPKPQMNVGAELGNLLGIAGNTYMGAKQWDQHQADKDFTQGLQTDANNRANEAHGMNMAQANSNATIDSITGGVGLGKAYGPTPQTAPTGDQLDTMFQTALKNAGNQPFWFQGRVYDPMRYLQNQIDAGFTPYGTRQPKTQQTPNVVPDVIKGIDKQMAPYNKGLSEFLTYDPTQPVYDEAGQIAYDEKGAPIERPSTSTDFHMNKPNVEDLYYNLYASEHDRMLGPGASDSVFVNHIAPHYGYQIPKATGNSPMMGQPTSTMSTRGQSVGFNTQDEDPFAELQAAYEAGLIDEGKYRRWLEYLSGGANGQ